MVEHVEGEQVGIAVGLAAARAQRRARLK